MKSTPYDQKIEELEKQIKALQFELERIKAKRDDFLNPQAYPASNH